MTFSQNVYISNLGTITFLKHCDSFLAIYKGIRQFQVFFFFF